MAGAEAARSARRSGTREVRARPGKRAPEALTRMPSHGAAARRRGRARQAGRVSTNLSPAAPRPCSTILRWRSPPSRPLAAGADPRSGPAHVRLRPASHLRRGPRHRAHEGRRRGLRRGQGDRGLGRRLRALVTTVERELDAALIGRDPAAHHRGLGAHVLRPARRPPSTAAAASPTWRAAARVSPPSGRSTPRSGTSRARRTGCPWSSCSAAPATTRCPRTRPADGPTSTASATSSSLRRARLPRGEDAGGRDGPARGDERGPHRWRRAPALGPDVELMVDSHGTFALPEAKRFARMVESANLRWFEEPTPSTTPSRRPNCAPPRTSRSRTARASPPASSSATSSSACAADVLQPDVAPGGRHHRGAPGRRPRGDGPGRARAAPVGLGGVVPAQAAAARRLRQPRRPHPRGRAGRQPLRASSPAWRRSSRTDRSGPRVRASDPAQGAGRRAGRSRCDRSARLLGRSTPTRTQSSPRARRDYEAPAPDAELSHDLEDVRAIVTRGRGRVNDAGR